MQIMLNCFGKYLITFHTNKAVWGKSYKRQYPCKLVPCAHVVTRQKANLRGVRASWRSCPSAGPAAPSVIQSGWSPVRRRQRKVFTKQNTETTATLNDPDCLGVMGDPQWPCWGPGGLLGNIHPSAPRLILFYCLRADGSATLTHLGSQWSRYSACHKSELYFDALNSNPSTCAPPHTGFHPLPGLLGMGEV